MQKITFAFNWDFVYDMGSICMRKNQETGMI